MFEIAGAVAIGILLALGALVYRWYILAVVWWIIRMATFLGVVSLFLMYAAAT